VNDLGTALTTALHLVAEADPAVLRIVGLSLRVSLAATLCAALVGLPLGALCWRWRAFPAGRRSSSR
jgi:tungstate transport system permease protein